MTWTGGRTYDRASSSESYSEPSSKKGGRGDGRDARRAEGKAIASLRRNDRVEGMATRVSHSESEMRLGFLSFVSILRIARREYMAKGI